MRPDEDLKKDQDLQFSIFDFPCFGGCVPNDCYMEEDVKSEFRAEMRPPTTSRLRHKSVFESRDDDDTVQKDDDDESCTLWDSIDDDEANSPKENSIPIEGPNVGNAAENLALVALNELEQLESNGIERISAARSPADAAMNTCKVTAKSLDSISEADPPQTGKTETPTHTIQTDSKVSTKRFAKGATKSSPREAKKSSTNATPKTPNRLVAKSLTNDSAKSLTKQATKRSTSSASVATNSTTSVATSTSTSDAAKNSTRKATLNSTREAMPNSTNEATQSSTNRATQSSTDEVTKSSAPAGSLFRWLSPARARQGIAPVAESSTALSTDKKKHADEKAESLLLVQAYDQARGANLTGTPPNSVPTQPYQMPPGVSLHQMQPYGVPPQGYHEMQFLNYMMPVSYNSQAMDGTPQASQVNTAVPFGVMHPANFNTPVTYYATSTTPINNAMIPLEYMSMNGMQTIQPQTSTGIHINSMPTNALQPQNGFLQHTAQSTHSEMQTIDFQQHAYMASVPPSDVRPPNHSPSERSQIQNTMQMNVLQPQTGFSRNTAQVPNDTQTNSFLPLGYQMNPNNAVPQQRLEGGGLPSPSPHSSEGRQTSATQSRLSSVRARLMGNRGISSAPSRESVPSPRSLSAGKPRSTTIISGPSKDISVLPSSSSLSMPLAVASRSRSSGGSQPLAVPSPSRSSSGSHTLAVVSRSRSSSGSKPLGKSKTFDDPVKVYSTQKEDNRETKATDKMEIRAPMPTQQIQQQQNPIQESEVSRSVKTQNILVPPSESLEDDESVVSIQNQNSGLNSIAKGDPFPPRSRSNHSTPKNVVSFQRDMPPRPPKERHSLERREFRSQTVPPRLPPSHQRRSSGQHDGEGDRGDMFRQQTEPHRRMERRLSWGRRPREDESEIDREGYDSDSVKMVGKYRIKMNGNNSGKGKGKSHVHHENFEFAEETQGHTPTSQRDTRIGRDDRRSFPRERSRSVPRTSLFSSQEHGRRYSINLTYSNDSAGHSIRSRSPRDHNKAERRSSGYASDGAHRTRGVPIRRRRRTEDGSVEFSDGLMPNLVDAFEGSAHSFDHFIEDVTTRFEKDRLKGF